MGIDKETVFKYLSIWIEKDSKLLKKFEEASNEELGDEEPKQLLINDDLGSISTEEYYFDETNNCICYGGDLIINGKTISIFFNLPLSDIVLIDILQHSIKKLNKLKQVMENLK